MKKFMANNLGKLFVSAILLAVVIWALCVYIPVRHRGTYTLCTVDDTFIQAELNVKWHRRMFSEDKVNGSITVDGVEYSIDKPEDVSGAQFCADGTDTRRYIILGFTDGPKLRFMELCYHPESDGKAYLYYYPATNGEEATAMFVGIYGR